MSRRAAGTALACAALAALVACTPSAGNPAAAGAPPASPDPRATAAGRPAASRAQPRDTDVLAIGDSLLVGAVEHGGLEAKLSEDRWTLEVLAERGRSVAWAIGALEHREEKVPHTVVVVLGTNPSARSGGFADDASWLIESLRGRGARRIVWIPPHDARDDRYAEKVEALAALAGGGVVVPDWGGVLADRPWLVGGDGIHLTELGYDELASYIRAQLARAA